MQKAAQILVQENKGEVPAQFEELIQLPGIGKYTAGAIPYIFRIYFLIVTRTHGQWFPCVVQ